MKKVFSIIIVCIIFFNNSVNLLFAEETKTSPYSLKVNFDLYKERVTNICEQYKTKKELVKIEDKYEEMDSGYDLDSIKSIYKENMNDIYKCALITIQKKSLLLIKDDLIKKNPSLLQNVGEKIDSKIDKLDSTGGTMGCKNNDDKSSIIKLNILKQTTYETCKYVSYLQYLKEYNNQIKALLPEGKQETTIGEVITQEYEKNNEIEVELEHVYKVFPMVFHALTEYENNISIHFLLELLKDDYIVFRDKLDEVLSPINQVVYKISNAMRK